MQGMILFTKGMTKNNLKNGMISCVMGGMRNDIHENRSGGSNIPFIRDVIHE